MVYKVFSFEDFMSDFEAFGKAKAVEIYLAVLKDYMAPEELKAFLNAVSLLDDKKIESLAQQSKKFDELIKNMSTEFESFINSLDSETYEFIYNIKSLESNLTYKMKQLFEVLGNDNVLAIEFNKQKEAHNLLLAPKFKLIANFVSGVTALEYADGLLTAAQIAERKNDYDFNVTVIQNTEEFKNYIDEIKSRPSNVTIHERFILADTHWIAGEILIDNNQTKILLIDSVSYYQRPWGNVTLYDMPEVLSVLAEAFQNKTIYYSAEQRQRDYESCGVYALDDVLHLYTLYMYLQRKNLFEYFAEQQVTAIKINIELKCPGKDPVEVLPVKLPLSLLRTYQPSQSDPQLEGFTTIIKSYSQEEQNQAINKKGDKISLNGLGLFENESGVQKNIRLPFLFNKMAKYNFKFIASHTIEEIYQAMKKHTVGAFKERLRCHPAAKTAGPSVF